MDTVTETLDKFSMNSTSPIGSFLIDGAWGSVWMGKYSLFSSDWFAEIGRGHNIFEFNDIV